MQEMQLPRGLPSWMLAILYVGLLATPFLLALTSGVDPEQGWRELASALGIAGAIMILMQFATSGRFALLSGRIGIDRTMAFHKWAANAALLAILLHPFLYAVPSFLQSFDRGITTLGVLFTAPRYQSGLVAWIAVIILVGSARFKDWLPLPYELWRASHAVLAVTAAVALVMHAIGVGAYAEQESIRWFWLLATAAAVASLLIIYALRSIWLLRDRWTLVSNRYLGGRMWELAFSRASGDPLPYRAGQFVWLTTAPRRFPLFDHPFSIASSPDDPELKLIIKEAGDYTNAIGSIPVGTVAGIDGPHGSFLLPEGSHHPLLLVAGGVGIAPIISLLRDIDRRRWTAPVRLAVAANNPDGIVLREEIEAISRRCDLRVLWIVDADAEERGFPWDGAIGRLGSAHLKELVADIDVRNGAAYICGPGGFMTSVADACVELGFPAAAVHYERFDYADRSLSRLDRRRRLRLRIAGLAACAGLLAFAFRG